MANQRPKSHKALFITATAALLSLACGRQSESSDKRSEDDHVAVVTTTTANNSGNASATANNQAPSASPASAVAPASTATQTTGQVNPAATAFNPAAAPLDPGVLLTQFTQQAGAHQHEMDAQIAALKAKYDAEHPKAVR